MIENTQQNPERSMILSLSFTFPPKCNALCFFYPCFTSDFENPLGFWNPLSYGFSSGHVWMWELDCKESWAPKNWCFWTMVLEKTLESPLDCKEIQLVHPKGDQSVLNIHWKDWCWSWNSNTLATSHTELTHWKRAWCWEGLGAGAEGDNRGWDDWMESPTRWTWVWINSRSWW